MPTYVYVCPRCEVEQELVRPIDQRDEPVYCVHRCEDVGCNEYGDELESFACPRVFHAPTVMNVALPDGNRRFNHLRRARELEREARATAAEQRAKLVKEAS